MKNAECLCNRNNFENTNESPLCWNNSFLFNYCKPRMSDLHTQHSTASVRIEFVCSALMWSLENCGELAVIHSPHLHSLCLILCTEKMLNRLVKQTTSHGFISIDPVTYNCQWHVYYWDYSECCMDFFILFSQWSNLFADELIIIFPTSFWSLRLTWFYLTECCKNIAKQLSPQRGLLWAVESLEAQRVEFQRWAAPLPALPNLCCWNPQARCLISCWIPRNV